MRDLESCGCNCLASLHGICHNDIARLLQYTTECIIVIQRRSFKAKQFDFETECPATISSSHPASISRSLAVGPIYERIYAVRL